MDTFLDVGFQVAFWLVGVLSTWFLVAYSTRLIRRHLRPSAMAWNLIGAVAVLWVLWAMATAADLWPDYPGRPVVRFVLGWLAVAVLGHRVWLLHSTARPRNPDDPPAR